MAWLVGKADPTGNERVRQRDKGKAEYIKKGENPRFVVTSLSRDEIVASPLYEEKYCARGESEQRP